MGDGTEQNPYTREDVLRLIEENGGTAKELDLSGKWFEVGIDLKETILASAHLEKANLVSAHLEGADLRDAHLEDAYLADAHLEGACLLGAHLKKVCLFGSHLEKAILASVHLEEVDLVSAHLEGANLTSAHLEGANLVHAHLEGAYLEDAEFSPETRLEEADWGNYIVGEERKRQFDSAVAVYRQLKVWYTNAGIHDIAAKFYYREKEVNRKALKWLSKSSFCHRLALELSYLVFGHGERWRRVPLSMAVLLLLFASAYYFGGNLEPLDSLYYSAVSFTALGYGKWALEPIGWVKGLGAFEAFIGVFMMALLLVTFVRKWTR